MPGYYDIPRAKGADAFRDQIVNFVCDRQEHSERYHMQFRRKLPPLYHLDRGTMHFRYQPFRNNVHIPIIHNLIRAHAAKLTEALVGQFPYVSFIGYGPDDAPIAHKQEMLVSAQLEDMNIYRKMYDLLVMEGLYGTAILQHGWKHKVGKRVVFDTVQLPLSTKTERIKKIVPVTEFDGPDVEPIDLLDCFPQPHATNIRDMQWFIVRKWVDWDAVVAMSIGAGATFDRPEVLRMEREGGGANDAFDWFKEARYNRFAYASPEMVWRTEPFARPVMIYEYWGIMPKELRKEGEVESYCITVANREYLLRYVANPHLHGEKPFLVFSGSPDPHFFYPPGKCELAAKMQIAANRFTNQQLDALDLYINPAFVFNELSGLDPDNAQLEPGRWMPMQGIVDGSFQAITPDMRGIEFGTAKTNEIRKWIQEAIGESADLSLGTESTGYETARSVLARQDAISARTLSEAKLCEKELIEPLANLMVSYNQQYLDTPRQVFILGRNSEQDPVTGQPIVGRTSITDWDLSNRYAARARGAISRLGKSMRIQNKMLLLQATGSNPIVAGATNWINFFRDLYTDMEYERVDEVLSTYEEYQQKLQLAGQLGGRAPQSTLPGAPASMGMQPVAA